MSWEDLNEQERRLACSLSTIGWYSQLEHMLDKLIWAKRFHDTDGIVNAYCTYMRYADLMVKAGRLSPAQGTWWKETFTKAARAALSDPNVLSARHLYLRQ